MAFEDLIARTDDAVRAHLGGVSVIYTPTVEAPVTVTGMFDERYVLVDAGGEAGVELIAPAVWLDVADLPVHPDDDDPTITIDGTDYTVVERKPDGLGTIRLILHKASL